MPTIQAALADDAKAAAEEARAKRDAELQAEREKEEAEDSQLGKLREFVGQKPGRPLYRALPAGQMIRLIKPGEMVTFDYRHNRFNFYLDDDGKISKVTRG